MYILITFLLQNQKYHSEHWVIVKGIAYVQIGNDQMILNKDQHIHIPIEVSHRIGNKQNENLHIIETQKVHIWVKMI